MDGNRIMKVKELMLQNAEFAEEVKRFTVYRGWDLKEVEEMPVQAYIQLLFNELADASEKLIKVLQP